MTALILTFGIAAACVRPGTDENAASESAVEPSLRLETGMVLTLAPTVLGLDLSALRSDEVGLKKLTITSAESDILGFRWIETVREETAASRRRREEFERKPPVAGVGEPTPQPPEPEFNLRQRQGRITASGVAESRKMTLPALWAEGDHQVESNSLIWMSRSAFRELRSTRETEWSLGLLESPLIQPAAAVLDLRRGLEALRKRLQGSPDERRDLGRIRAEEDFSSFRLTVDGRRAEVRTIVARNWFAQYVVLDRDDNPLILEVTLNPISGGALDVFSPLMALKSLLGYRVVAIETGKR